MSVMVDQQICQLAVCLSQSALLWVRIRVYQYNSFIIQYILLCSIIIEKGPQGHATLKTTGCSLNIGHLDVNFHGGASWLYNLFDSTIEGTLKSSLQGQVYSEHNICTNNNNYYYLIYCNYNRYVVQQLMLSIKMEVKH